MNERTNAATAVPPASSALHPDVLAPSQFNDISPVGLAGIAEIENVGNALWLEIRRREPAPLAGQKQSVAVEVGGLRLVQRRVAWIDRRHAKVTAEPHIGLQDTPIDPIHRNAKVQP